LGLHSEDSAYSGTAAFYSNSGFQDPKFKARFMGRINGGTLLRFYACHPERACGLLVRAFSEAGETRPNLGNFDPAEGRPPFARSQAFALWSQLRERLFRQHGLRYVLITLTTLGLLLIRSTPDWRIAAVCLAIAVLLEAGLCGLADSVDTARHFTVFCEMEDASLLILAAAEIARTSRCDRRSTS
jgi:hypothetical protein